MSICRKIAAHWDSVFKKFASREGAYMPGIDVRCGNFGKHDGAESMMIPLLP